MLVHTYFLLSISIFTIVLSRSHAKRIWGSCMGFKFLMDANTSKVFLQLFHGSKANSNKPLKNEKISGIERLVLPFPDT